MTITPFGDTVSYARGASQDAPRIADIVVATNADGSPIGGATATSSWNYAAAAGGIINTTTAVTIKTAAGAGIRNYVSSIQLATDTLTTASELAIRDGAAGPVLWRGKLAAATLNEVGLVFSPALRGSANTLLEVVTLTATGAALGVYISAQGYTGA